MITISKKICPEDIISRECGIFPSYKDGNLVAFIKDKKIDLEKFKKYPNGNYGMFPCNISYKAKSSEKAEIISYSEGFERYLFLKWYYGKLGDYSFDTSSSKYVTSYKSYEDCVKSLSGITDADDLSEAKEIDLKAVEYGGMDFYSGFSKNVLGIIHYPSITDNKEEWVLKKDKKWAYITESVEELGWMKEKYSKYSGTTQCSEYEDCCDCSEYRERGGDNYYKWLSGAVENFIVDDEVFSSTTDCNINISILATNKMKNIGNWSSMAEEYPLGYSNVKSGDTFISDGIMYSYGKADITDISKLSASTYDETTNTWKFNVESWKIVDIGCSPDVVYYSYKDGVYMNDTSLLKMSDSYPLRTNENGLFIIGEETYDAFESEYIKIPEEYQNTYIRGNIYLVDRYSNGIPYVTIGGKRYMAKYDSKDGYFFSFGAYNLCDSGSVKIKILSGGVFIDYNGSPKLVTKDKKVKISPKYGGISYEYTSFSADCNVNGDVFQIYDGKVSDWSFDNSIESAWTQVFKETSGTSLGKYVSSENYSRSLSADSNESGYFIYGGNLHVLKPFIVHKSGYLSGITESKIESLLDYAKSYDDMGNELDGKIIEENKSYYSQPSGGTLLDLYYTIGNTSDMTFISGNTADTAVYWGDILSDLIFYYKNGEERIPCEGIKSSDFKSSNLSAITSAETFLNEYLSSGGTDLYSGTSMYCDVVSYMGTYIDVKFQNNSAVSIDIHYDNNKYLGVKYTDTFSVKKIKIPYYLNDGTSYFLNGYDLQRDKEEIKMDDYSDSSGYSYQAKFELYTDVFSSMTKVNLPCVMSNYGNGLVEEPQVDGEILVDRGIVEAQEKHLKLMEIKTMESLENYGNGWFSMISN